MAMLVAWCLPSPWTPQQQDAWLTTSSTQKAKQSQQHLFGFFLNEYKQPKASLEAIKSVAAFMPGSPVYLVGTGYHYEPLAQRFDDVHFVYDDTNVDMTSGTVSLAAIDLYLRRVRDAALYCNCSYLVLLEPDVLLRGPIRQAPAHDAGGVADHWNKQWPAALEDEFHVSRWSHEHWGMCGGSYVKVDSYLQAYATLDYSRLQRMQNVSGWKGIVAVQDTVLAIMFMDQGYTLRPWTDLAELGKDDRTATRWTPVVHKVKRFYNEPLTPEDGPVISNEEAQAMGWPVYAETTR